MLFAALLIAVCLIFSIMGHFYTYVNPDRLDEMFSEDTIDDEKNLKRHPRDEVPLKKLGRNSKI